MLAAIDDDDDDDDDDECEYVVELRSLKWGAACASWLKWKVCRESP